jgi:beta-glucosidase
VYLGAPDQPPTGAQFAPRALVGFDRVNVPAGETKTVRLHIPRRGLEYWSTAADKWAVAAGPRTVYVGSSSRDLRLQAEMTIQSATK